MKAVLDATEYFAVELRPERVKLTTHRNNAIEACRQNLGSQLCGNDMAAIQRALVEYLPHAPPPSFSVSANQSVVVIP